MSGELMKKHGRLNLDSVHQYAPGLGVGMGLILSNGLLLSSDQCEAVFQGDAFFLEGIESSYMRSFRIVLSDSVTKAVPASDKLCLSL